MEKSYFESAGEGKYHLKAVITTTGEGVNIYVGGGEKPHIGTIVVSQPRESLKGNGEISCTTSVFNLVGHKDDGIALPLAERLCKKINQVVVVTAGVHVSNAAVEDIEELIKSGKELTEKILDIF